MEIDVYLTTLMTTDRIDHILKKYKGQGLYIIKERRFLKYIKPKLNKIHPILNADNLERLPLYKDMWDTIILDRIGSVRLFKVAVRVARKKVVIIQKVILKDYEKLIKYLTEIAKQPINVLLLRDNGIFDYPQLKYEHFMEAFL